MLGTIYRNDRAFHQAYKYYQTALYHDGKNEKVLRELASVQLQLRDFDGHLKTRRTLWKSHPEYRVNWVGYAIACHLSGEYEYASHLVKLVHESCLSDTDMPTNRWETQNQHSELLLYRNFILRDSCQSDSALSDLLNSQPRILDKLHVRELLAELYIRTGKLDQAKTAFAALIDYNPDNIQYHYGLLISHGLPIPYESIFSRSLDTTGKRAAEIVRDFATHLTPDLKATLTSTYSQLQAKYPKSLVTQQMPLLHWLEGSEFAAAFQAYARPMFTKGVPSLFNSVKSLYKNSTQVALIDAWIRASIERLEKESKFPSSEVIEEPTTLLWVYYFFALHELIIGDYEAALQVVSKAIEHTPTVMDLYLVKAKILSKAGDDVGAAECVEKARTMDLADRNLNTLSVKYWLKACNPTKASQNLAIFTKLDLSHYSNVFTMQVMWYESLLGEAEQKLGNLAKSLKSFRNTVEHFHEINEDQYDFFHYSVRFFTISTFVRLMRMEDRLHGQEHYVKAAKGLLRGYLRLDDALQSRDSAAAAFSPSMFSYNEYYQLDESEPEAANEGGKKKAPPPKKKPASGDSGSGAASSSSSGASVKTWNGKQDPDPNGEQLVSTKVPLKTAAVFAENLMLYAWDDLEAHLLCAEYYTCTKQYLLAMRSLLRAIELKGATYPETHRSIVRFAIAWTQQDKKTPSQRLNESVDAKLKKMLNEQTLMAYNDAFASSEQAKRCFASRLAGTTSATLHS